MIHRVYIYFLIIPFSYYLWRFLIRSPEWSCIIIDAGSTGTRLHLFEFEKVVGNDGKWNVKYEEVKFVSPGLSAYAQNISGIKRSFNQLLRQVSLDDKAPVFAMVGATAGLRLLGANVADKILREVRETLQNYNEILLNNKSVIMLSEKREAELGLEGLIYALGTSDERVGTLEMGGGSIQIAENADESDMYSFLGLGLKSARLSLLTTGENEIIQDNIVSECLPKGYLGDWDLHGVNYKLRSNQSSDEFLFSKCYRAAEQFIAASSIKSQKWDFNGVHLYLMGYFYDRIADVQPDRLNNVSSSGSAITSVYDYSIIAMEACRTTNHKSPFQCLDLVYIYNLLKNGLDIPDNMPLYVAKKINNLQLGWTLGAAVELATQNAPQ